MTALLLHTVPETAKILRTSPVNVYTIVKRGELAAIRFGRRLVIADEDLRVFIEKHRTERAAG